MARLDSNTTAVKVTVNIITRPATEYQRRCWVSFWRKLIAEATSSEKRAPTLQAPNDDARNDSGEEEISDGRQ